MALQKVDISMLEDIPLPGIAGKVLSSDGTNWINADAAGLPATGADGNVLTSDGTNWASEESVELPPAGGDGQALMSDGTNWASEVIPVHPELIHLTQVPAVTSISDALPTQTEIEAGFDLIITGTDFISGCTIDFIGNDTTSYAASIVTFNSGTSVTGRIPTNIDPTKEPFTVKVTNSSGLNGSLSNAFSINADPSFSVASGTLGSLPDSNLAGSQLTTIAATDPESGVVTVTASGYPAGLTLSSSGVWGGTASAVSADTTTTFTATATDDAVPYNAITRSYSISVLAPPTMVNVLNGITNSDGYTLSSAYANNILIMDPADSACYSGSGSTVNNVSPNHNAGGTMTDMTIGGSGDGKYFLNGSGDPRIDYGSASTYWQYVSNNTINTMAYCGWVYATTEFDDPGGENSGMIWFLNDGDWGPSGQFGFTYGRSVSHPRAPQVHAGNTNRHTSLGNLIPDWVYTNKWCFFATWHKMSGGMVICQGLQSDTNLTTIYSSSTESSSTFSAANRPWMMAARPDNYSEHTPQGYRWGKQAFWGNLSSGGSGNGLTSSFSNSVPMFEAIFDATKSHYA